MSLAAHRQKSNTTALVSKQSPHIQSSRTWFRNVPASFPCVVWLLLAAWCVGLFFFALFFLAKGLASWILTLYVFFDEAVIGWLVTFALGWKSFFLGLLLLYRSFVDCLLVLAVFYISVITAVPSCISLINLLYFAHDWRVLLLYGRSVSFKISDGRVSMVLVWLRMEALATSLYYLQDKNLWEPGCFTISLG